ncbi:hypothetical protein AT257_06725 [Bacillus cereus]|uniref:disulfide oxidoreductase n=1 Tax=Bacillus mycoides TaxID=1405 RepID=UPI00077A33C9|nr:disulfide oxidoreductase [Bacillus mycoides]KXY40031.1 hypothetical protein AT257_06725 [Bacillus cereus]QWG87700.1 disulfide bond formation protein B [Bacillus mycoides]
MQFEKKLEYTLFIAWGVSFVSTIGSLYFSEIMKFTPCTLCWYQRILMYPLILILGIALTKKDYNIANYSFPIATIGFCISLYHYATQKISFISETTPACGRIPCTAEYINWFNFITIPFLALIGFSIIMICSFILLKTTMEIKK